MFELSCYFGVSLQGTRQLLCYFLNLAALRKENVKNGLAS